MEEENLKIKGLKKQIQELSREGYKTLFKSTYLGFQKTIICFLINKKTQGFVIGLSSGKGQYDFFKAFEEACINLFLGGSGESPKESVDRIKKDGVNTLRDHRDYWLYKKKIPQWVLENAKEIKNKRKVKPKIKNHILLKKNAYVVASSSEDLIPLLVGKPDTKKLLKINRFGFNMTDLDELVHPIP